MTNRWNDECQLTNEELWKSLRSTIYMNIEMTKSLIRHSSFVIHIRFDNTGKPLRSFFQLRNVKIGKTQSGTIYQPSAAGKFYTRQVADIITPRFGKYCPRVQPFRENQPDKKPPVGLGKPDGSRKMFFKGVAQSNLAFGVSGFQSCQLIMLQSHFNGAAYQGRRKRIQSAAAFQ